MPTRWTRNRLIATLGVDYPVIQGPFGGFASQKLTSAVSNFGGLGSLGANSLDPHAITDVIAELRTLTSKPFAINLWVSTEDEGARASDERAFNGSLAPLVKYLDALGAPRPAYRPYSPMRFEEQARAVVDARVPVMSFIFGVPPADLLQDCRARGIVTIGTATTPDEAIALERAGLDVIAASGFEGGGHRGSFLGLAEDSLTGTFSLVPQIVDAVSLPVIAAGGIADARGVVAALALGAEGVQIGTALLKCEGSGASSLHRATLHDPAASRTGLTKGLTGRLARGIRNTLMDDLNRPGTDILPYPLQRALVKHLSNAADAAGRADLVTMWAGQSAALSQATDAVAFLQSLVDDVSAVADPIAGWRDRRRPTSPVGPRSPSTS